ncbi:YceI family protein [Flammeovirgaceae bacterium SG7u.111]|nr:YceI family protein [Flammeovirgaceae bacterium SG7u.132]WPO38195.1 YceI family protein [Flammeovirgaceae bacterium SG7u.111]
MKKNITTLLLSILVVSASIAQTVDSEKSIVNFKIDNMKINTVEGTFSGMNGNVNFNTNNPANSTFDVRIDASTVNTDKIMFKNFK